MKWLAVETPVYEALIRACRTAYPKEACGFLGGIDGLAVSHYPVANVADAPTLRFLMDPQGQMEALHMMKSRSEDLVAIYHSHPRTSAVPSNADIEQALYPRAYYIIVGLLGPTPDVRTFRLNRESNRAVEVGWRRIGTRKTKHF